MTSDSEIENPYQETLPNISSHAKIRPQGADTTLALARDFAWSQKSLVTRGQAPWIVNWDCRQ